jgi:phenylacetate-CoA ligase
MNSPAAEQRRQLMGLDRVALATWQLDKLNRLLGYVRSSNRFYAEKLTDVQLPLRGIEELSGLPFTTKQELVPPAGHHARNLTHDRSAYARFHRTSGTHGHPLVVLDTVEDWNWWTNTWQFVLDAASVTSTDRAAMAFSFGPFIGFWSANDALLARGALVIPLGGLNSIARLQLILDEQATIVCCTPSYALHLASLAEQHAIPLADSSVRVLIVAGEPGGSVPAIRERIQTAWNATLVDHAGATEIGPWGFAAPDGRGLHVVESEFIAEYLTLKDHRPAAEGEIAELVLTNLGRYGAPLVRYRTGDLVKPRYADSTAENQFVLLEGGVLGRVDDMMIVRGVNVYPSAIEQILREIPDIQEYRLTVRKHGEMDALEIEIEDLADRPERIVNALRLRLGLHVEVHTVPSGSLPRFEHKGQRFRDERK